MSTLSSISGYSSLSSLSSHRPTPSLSSSVPLSPTSILLSPNSLGLGLSPGPHVRSSPSLPSSPRSPRGRWASGWSPSASVSDLNLRSPPGSPGKSPRTHGPRSPSKSPTLRKPFKLTNPPKSPRRLRKPPVVIDYQRFPHIIEQICQHACPDVLRAVRATCRSLRVTADKIAPTHLVVYPTVDYPGYHISVPTTGEVLGHLPQRIAKRRPKRQLCPVGCFGNDDGDDSSGPPWGDNVSVLDFRSRPPFVGTCEYRLHTLRHLSPSNLAHAFASTNIPARRLIVGVRFPEHREHETWRAPRLAMLNPPGLRKLVVHVTCDTSRPHLPYCTIGNVQGSEGLRHVVIIFHRLDTPTAMFWTIVAGQPIGLLRHMRWLKGMRYTLVDATELDPICFGLPGGPRSHAELKSEIVNVVMPKQHERQWSDHDHKRAMKNVEFMSLEEYEERLHPYDFKLETDMGW